MEIDSLSVSALARIVQTCMYGLDAKPRTMEKKDTSSCGDGV